MTRLLLPGLALLGAAAQACAQGSAPPQSKGTPSPARLECRVLGPEENWDDAAKFVAGMSPAAYPMDLEPEVRDAWRTYAASIRSDWTRLQRRYVERIGAWRARVLNAVPSGGAILYPFSGPDAATAMAFYPDASEYILIGLEPGGCIPPALEAYTATYFPDLRRSLANVVSMGFFKTEEMKQEFRESEVTGVLPLLLVVLERSGYNVEDVTAMGIAADGALVTAASGVRRETRGIAIRFRDDKHGTRTLRYFSLDLENSSLQRRPGTMRYFRSLPVTGALIKSASYLPHKRYFSTIRSVILERSATVVQDDSGVPFGMFDPRTWDVRLFGTYSKPIELFQRYYQEDLKAAYTAAKAQPLDFGIGYQWRPNESTLIVASRRR